MDENSIRQNSEACLEFINSKFDYYKQILDHERKLSDEMIESIRQQACLLNETDDEFRSRTQIDRFELANQLDYLEQEVYKTYEENKTCLFKMFQNLFNLHREFAFDDVLVNEQQIGKVFRYHPCLISNIDKLASSIKTSKEKFSFSNRSSIAKYQQKTNIEYPSNEIDLTQFIRDTNRSENFNERKFNFSTVSKYSHQQKSASQSTINKYPTSTVSCESALLSATNKRFVLLHNMNVITKLYIFDMNNDRTKDFPWDEGTIFSLGHVDSNIFYIITQTKILLFDVIKEILTKEYFLYDTLYKDFLLIFNDNSYRTILKANNQLQSFVFDDYCYYLYTNKDYNQILIKCSLDNFQQERNINLTKTYPQITTFLGFVITNKSLITFLIFQSNTYALLLCDESRNYIQIKQIPLTNVRDASQILSTSQTNVRSMMDRQIWLILDRILNCIHCLTNDKYVKNIPSTKSLSIQSISIYEQKLVLAYNEFFVDSLDLDELFI